MYLPSSLGELVGGAHAGLVLNQRQRSAGGIL